VGKERNFVMEYNKAIELMIREIEIRNFSNKTKSTYIFAVKQFFEYKDKQELNENLVKNYIQQLLKIFMVSNKVKSRFISFFKNSIKNSILANFINKKFCASSKMSFLWKVKNFLYLFRNPYF
jgi:hypothetical protein